MPAPAYLLRIRPVVLRRVYVALIALVAMLGGRLMAAPVATAADFTWSGGGSSPNWSDGGNWQGGVAPAPSSSIGRLTFPLRPSQTNTNSDVSGLSVNALQVDDSHGYGIMGDGFTLGSGGLTITASEGTGGQFSIINPMTLASSQTWSVSGPPAPSVWPAQDVELRSVLSGSSSDLTINLSSLTNFVFGINVAGAPSVDDEIGNITVNGSEAKSRVVIAPNAKLNASDGHSLTLHHVDLEGGESIGAINAEGSFITSYGTTGAITAKESHLELSGTTGPVTAADSTLELSGASVGAVTATKSSLLASGTVSLPGLSLDGTSTLNANISLQGSESYSRIMSAGTVNLGGATLALHIAETEGCPPPHVGQVYTLVSTTGNLSGTFGNVPNGGTINADCTPAITQGLEPISYASPYRINYNTGSSPETVTATALPLPSPPTATAPPTITGSAIESQTLSESHGSWTNSPTSYGYQWQRCDGSGNNCQPISGASAQTYLLTVADVGHAIRVAETASNANGASTPAVSAPTGVVQAAPLPPVSCCDRSISSAQIMASLAAQLVPSGKGARIATLLKHGGYTMPFTALEAGTLTVQWYLVPHGAKLARKAKGKTKARPVLVASGKATFPGAGSGMVKIRLTAAGRRLLRHAKRLKLVARGTFTAGTSRISTQSSLTLRN